MTTFRLTGIGIAFAAVGAAASSALAATPPAIRTSPYNQVPACVTPARLMAFLRDRNPKLDPRFDEIAKWYKKHGETWQVRWDYAFFQMIIETNHLSYKTGNGRWGDVNPKQNNFAGIGTTGGGVPGDGYPDVSTGVLAQIQHLVAYSGERLEKPVGQRTQLRQDDIIAISARLKRTVTFGDLAGRWAVDRRYARSIEWVADRFRAIHCNGRSPIPDDPPPPALVKKPELVAARARPKPAPQVRAAMVTGSVAPPPAVMTAAMSIGLPAAKNTVPAAPAAAKACNVQTASYVGKTGQSRTLLIRVETGDEIQITALQVLDGFERSMGDGFIRARAPGGTIIGSFETPAAAIAQAAELCARKG